MRRVPRAYLFVLPVVIVLGLVTLAYVLVAPPAFATYGTTGWCIKTSFKDGTNSETCESTTQLIPGAIFVAGKEVSQVEFKLNLNLASSYRLSRILQSNFLLEASGSAGTVQISKVITNQTIGSLPFSYTIAASVLEDAVLPVGLVEGNFNLKGKGGYRIEVDDLEQGRKIVLVATLSDFTYSFTTSQSTFPGGSRLSVVQLGADKTNGFAPLEVLFWANSNQGVPPYQYVLEYGDGQEKRGSMSDILFYISDVSHTYQTAGTYTAKITVRDSAGSTVTKSLTITVQAVPTGPHKYEGYTRYMSSFSWNPSSTGAQLQTSPQATTVKIYTRTDTIFITGTTSRSSDGFFVLPLAQGEYKARFGFANDVSFIIRLPENSFSYWWVVKWNYYQIPQVICINKVTGLKAPC